MRSRFRKQVDANTEPRNPNTDFMTTASDEMFKALSVMVRDRKIRAYLKQNDPQALLQAELALHGFVRGWTPGLRGSTREMRTIEEGLTDIRQHLQGQGQHLAGNRG